MMVSLRSPSRSRRGFITSGRFQALLVVASVVYFLFATSPETFSAYQLAEETFSASADAAVTVEPDQSATKTIIHSDEDRDQYVREASIFRGVSKKTLASGTNNKAKGKAIDNSNDNAFSGVAATAGIVALAKSNNDNKSQGKKITPREGKVSPRIMKPSTDTRILPLTVDKDVFPGPPKKFSPQIFDADGIPNVLHGCGNSTKVNYQIQIHVQIPSLSPKNHQTSFWEQLQRAEMSGWNSRLPLYIHTTADNGDLPGLTNKWKYGPVYVRRSNTTDWWDTLAKEAQKAGNNTLLISISDQINLSAFYFQFLQQILYKYARQPRCRDSNLFGISLSPVDSKRENRLHHAAFLSSYYYPSTDTMAYWSDQFMSFYRFVILRRRTQVSSPFPSHFTSTSTSTLTNIQLLADYLFGRGLIILYPTLQLAGNDVSKPVLSKWPKDFFLAPYGDLAVLDHQLQLSTKEILMATGTKFLNHVAQQCDNCQELLQTWSRPGVTIPSRWTQDNPLLCIADAYSSAELMSRQTFRSKSNATRYLLFEPQFGTNNQIHAIMEAYYWAKLLGRQLVVPPILTPRVSAYLDAATNRTSWIEFSKFYRLLSMNSQNLFGSDFQPFPGHDLPPISFTEFEKLQLQPWRFLRLTRHTPFDPSTRLIAQSMGLPTDDEIVNLKHLFNKAVGVKRVQHLLGGCEDQVLAVDNLYFAALKEAQPRQRMSATIGLTDAVQTNVERIERLLHAELGSANYSCYHVRQGDFAQMCETIEKPSTEDTREVSEWLRKEAQDFQCFVRNDDLKVELLADPRPALVLSDNPGAFQDAMESTSTKKVSSNWVYNVTRTTSKLTGRELAILSLIVDQTLCAKADVALLNRFSTVSQRVASLRKAKGVRYWQKAKRKN